MKNTYACALLALACSVSSCTSSHENEPDNVRSAISDCYELALNGTPPGPDDDRWAAIEECLGDIDPSGHPGEVLDACFEEQVVCITETGEPERCYESAGICFDVCEVAPDEIGDVIDICYDEARACTYTHGIQEAGCLDMLGACLGTVDYLEPFPGHGKLEEEWSEDPCFNPDHECWRGQGDPAQCEKMLHECLSDPSQWGEAPGVPDAGPDGNHPPDVPPSPPVP